MGHKPRASIGDSEQPVKLMGAHSLLARAQKMNCQEPLVKWNMAILKDRSDSDRELLSTASTLPESLAGFLNPLSGSLELGDLFWCFLGRRELVGFASQSAMGTNRAFRPSLLF